MLRNFAGWLVAAALAMPFAAHADSAGIRGIQVAANMTGAPHLNSHTVLVLNGANGEALYQKNTDLPLPFASITKLMTAMVTLDAGLSMDEPITITESEIDRLKNTSSRLSVGTTLPRREMLLLALMSSENRAAAALARTYPGGTQAFVAQMNRKARALGMNNTVFYDPTGLEVRNTATAMDLARMVRAANGYPLIRTFTTTQEHEVVSGSRRMLHYKNSNALVREGDWDISLQKTGYIQEAGRCMVLQTTVGSQPLIIVLLAAGAPSARVNDARAIRNWLERHPGTWLAG
ncbi:serine hydrolase [Pseudogulbenkiania subflava]|uniref:D-alanyl-D-alanine endopeptidase (Penicillin-binding protein 7) n=1 Tax=Pseudogulbenkiania subflava DSM 22618 TaxID=1123014 RepID=A0A1Y6BXE0_9NEIS|nr:serine hydrolase [Pseudogulbenkiania subflava]SMF24825.1 D-alanyl-D-alanine endopeptidase (penicillin-binding protein 7) [Pseudogulbenkiania subflava DSM 22618]